MSEKSQNAGSTGSQSGPSLIPPQRPTYPCPSPLHSSLPKRQHPFIKAHHHFPEIVSTNTFALQLAEGNAPEATVITADSQTKGRGQRSRIWLSPPGKGLYYSIILRPHISADKVFLMTLMAGIAVYEAIRQLYCLVPELKWPNDILIRGRKVAGILTESSWLGSVLNYVVIGIGINVSWKHDEFPSDLYIPATSLHLETPARPDPNNLVWAISDNIDLWYKRLQNGASPEILSHWVSRSPMFGQTIFVDCSKANYKGIARGLEHDGSLIVETETEGMMTFSSGSIRFT